MPSREALRARSANVKMVEFADGRLATRGCCVAVLAAVGASEVALEEGSRGDLEP